MDILTFDIEADGLLDTVTKIHCLSYRINDGPIYTIYDYDQMRILVSTASVLAGHSIILYDLPLVKMLLGVEPKDGCLIYDSLAISWYLKPLDRVHGLEYYGDELELPKVEIKDWIAGTREEYRLRCERDVEINYDVITQQIEYLMEIYDGEFPYKLIAYLNFKMRCLRDQAEKGINFDRKLCEESLAKASTEYTQREMRLSDVMPKENAKLIKRRPKKMYKADGTMSALGEKWFAYLEEHNLPFDTVEHRDPPNPGSHTQLKKWLFSIGWKPRTFKESKATGEKLPQVSLPFGGGICPSITDMYDTHPELEALEGFYMIKHRVGIFKSFLDSEKNGRLYAGAQGFTNTLRLAHKKPIANLPKPGVPWGTEIRSCLIADEGEELMGFDISGLESATAHHYISFFDPKYVEEMRTPGFDPHTDLAVLAGLMTKEDEEFFKWANTQEELSPEDKARLSSIKKKRSIGKSGNFSMQYNAQPPKVAEVTKLPMPEAIALHAKYWERNWALEAIVNNTKRKRVRNQMWQWNPVAEMWYFLKKKKDSFSTLNQGSGVYVFDTVLRNFVDKVEKHFPDVKVVCQYHDELFVSMPKGNRELMNSIIREAMAETNKELNLNVTVECDAEYGQTYSEIH